MTTILGLSAYYHDLAACLVRDGEIVAAAQEAARVSAEVTVRSRQPRGTARRIVAAGVHLKS